MPNPTDFNLVIFRVDKEQPVIADSETQFSRRTLQSLEIACTGLGEPVQGGKNAHCQGLVQGPDVSSRLIRPKDLLQAPSL
jgi:hypothetical protein